MSRSATRATGPLAFATFIVSALILFLAGSTWLALYPAIPVDLGGVPNLDRRAERVSIPVGAGDHLNGWFIPGTRPATVILFHGYGRDHHRAWRYATFLNRAGYGVLATDFRSSRETDRKPTTLGYYELEDARATLRWLEREPRSRGRSIGLLGESLGGSVALALAALNPEVRAVVADCPFESGRRALEDSFERWAHVPRWPAAPIAAAMGGALTGHDPRSLDALAAARRLRERPVFIIACDRDDRLSAAQARDLWSAAGAKDPLWTLPDCGHNDAWKSHRSEYERRVLGFFDSHLAPPRAGVAGAATRALR